MDSNIHNLPQSPSMYYKYLELMIKSGVTGKAAQICLGSTCTPYLAFLFFGVFMPIGFEATTYETQVTSLGTRSRRMWHKFIVYTEYKFLILTAQKPLSMYRIHW